MRSYLKYAPIFQKSFSIPFITLSIIKSIDYKGSVLAKKFLNLYVQSF